MYSGTTYDGDSIFGTLPYQTLADGSWGNGFGFGIGDAFGMNISCTDSIAATLHWVPDYPGEPHPPQVIVKETCSASWFGESRASVRGSCNNALGFPEVDNINPPDSSGSSSGTLYTLMAGADTLPLPARSPSASASESVGDLEASVGYIASAEPLEVILSGGIGPPDAKRFLIGQQVTAALESGGLTGASYHWTASGSSPFKTYTANTSNGTFVAIGTETDPSFWFHFARPGTATVTCSAHLVVPDGAKPEGGIDVTANRNCSVEAPTFRTNQSIGSIQMSVPPALNPGLFLVGARVTDPYGATESGFGTYWSGEVDPVQDFVAAYGNGQWNFTQLVVPHFELIAGGIHFAADKNDIWMLDTYFPYAATYPCDSFWYTTGDRPGIGMDDNATTYLYVAMVFKVYVLYLPGGDGSCYVPLKEIDWKWGASATKGANGAWTLSVVTAPSIWEGGSFPDHPTWTMNVAPIHWIQSP